MTENYSFLGEFQVLKLLSNGTHSKIKLVKCRNNDVYYAAHIFKVPEFFQYFEKEVHALESINTERTIRLVEAHQSGNYLKKDSSEYFCKYFIVEFMEIGNLCDLTEGITPLSDESVKYLFKSILHAVQDLHVTDYCHRTISAKNILFNKDFQIKLSGLTYCERISESLHTQVTSKKYLAPEVMKQDPYDGVLPDIFSLGVILFYLKTNRLPFFSINPSDLHMNLFIRDKKKFWNNFERKNQLSNQVKNLIEKMIDPSIENRACFNDIINHIWFNSAISTTEEFKLEIETKRQEINKTRSTKRQDGRNHIEYRGVDIDSGSLDLRITKPQSNIQLFRSNIIWSNFNPRELINIVSSHGLKNKFKLSFSDQYFQINVIADTYEDNLKYKGFVYEINGIFALELEFIEGNYFDFCEVNREIRKIVCSDNNLA